MPHAPVQGESSHYDVLLRSTSAEEAGPSLSKSTKNFREMWHNKRTTIRTSYNMPLVGFVRCRESINLPLELLSTSNVNDEPFACTRMYPCSSRTTSINSGFCCATVKDSPAPAWPMTRCMGARWLPSATYATSQQASVSHAMPPLAGIKWRCNRVSDRERCLVKGMLQCKRDTGTFDCQSCAAWESLPHQTSASVHFLAWHSCRSGVEEATRCDTNTW